MDWIKVDLVKGIFPEKKKYSIVCYMDDGFGVQVDLGYLDFKKEHGGLYLVIDGKRKTWYKINRFIAWQELPEPPEIE